jgi:hypothetical protein
MRITWKDGMTTFLLGMVVLLAMAATQGWDWPLMGSYRSASMVVFAAGIGMCALGGSTTTTASVKDDPYVAFGAVLGTASLVVWLLVLITGSEAWFVTLVASIAILWAVATVHHLMRRAPRVATSGPVTAS